MRERTRDSIRGSRGFTLLELLIVIAIIAVLIGVAIPVFSAQMNRAKFTTDAVNVSTGYSQAILIAQMGPSSDYDKLTASGGLYLLTDGSLGTPAEAASGGAKLYEVSVRDYRGKVDCVANIGGHDVDFGNWGATVTYQWYPDTKQLRINDNYLQF